MELPPPANEALERKRNNLPRDDRKAAYHMLLGMADGDDLERGAISTVAALFSVNRSTISRLWRQVRQRALSNHNLPADAEPIDIYATDAAKRKKGKYKHDREALKEAVKALPSSRRKRYRWLAAALDLPVSTVHYLTKGAKLFRRARSCLKPTLTLDNRLVRLDHCLTKIVPSVDPTIQPRYSNMYDEVHVDEKWFFLCRDGESYIVVADEEEPPDRYVKHKSHITKVMFLCAQARPRLMPNGTRGGMTMWDGKIGIWPIGEWKAAQRSSIHRPAGTMEFHGKSVDRDTYREYIVDKVLPSIATKWPRPEWNGDEPPTIYIQQDGATSHINPWDPAIEAKLQTLGVAHDRIKLVTQPPNSPDLNLNDLGFFNSLQSTYYQTCPSNAMELIQMVQETYSEYPAAKINRIWLTLQSCMNEIIKVHGCNQYTIPHMGKEKMEKENRLPVALEVCPEAEGLY